MPLYQAVLDALGPALSAVNSATLAACDGALARVWLAGPGDSCPSCPMRPECPSQTTCLHLVASAGLTKRLDGPFRRYPVGARVVGRVPVTHEPILAREELAALGVAEPAWLALHRVRSFAALPLDHAERCIGVLAVFSRGDLPEDEVRLLEATARLGAEALGNVGAYRVLAADRNRLAAKNARLRAGLGLPEDPAVAPAPPPAATAVDTAGRLATTGAMLRLDSSAAAQPSFAEIQRRAIIHALEGSNWRVSGPRGAAAVLGLRPTTLESKMKRLGIRRPPR
jgi:transcriptional regulator with GAF, ATPase, and Fis domain